MPEQRGREWSAGPKRAARGPNVYLQVAASSFSVFASQSLGASLAGRLIASALSTAVASFLLAEPRDARRRFVVVALLVALLQALQQALAATASLGAVARPDAGGPRPAGWLPASWAVVAIAAVAGFGIGSAATAAAGNWSTDGGGSAPAAGHHLVVVPDVTGEPSAAAVARLERRGLGARVEPPSAGADAKVRAMRPAAGSEVPRGERVILVVRTPGGGNEEEGGNGAEGNGGAAGGGHEGEVEVPALAGSAEKDAEAELTALGLPSSFEYVHSEVHEGYVVETSPAGGEFVTPGTPITVFVSRGPEPAATCEGEECGETECEGEECEETPVPVTPSPVPEEEP